MAWMRTNRRSPLRASLALLAALAAPPALAQSEAELARARQLYSQGLTQEAAGDWAGALGTFQSVAQIKMNPQVRFHIARCKENLGRLNEALGGYRLAEYEAGQAGDKSAALADEIRVAREALEARVPKIVIERGDGAEAIKIELDGVVLGQAQIGKEISVDPGPHVVTGVLADGRTFKQTVELGEGKSETLRLDVPDDLRAVPATPPAAAAASDSPGGQSASLDTATVSSGSAAPWVIGGLGVASLVASGVFFALKSSAESELDRECLGRVCPDTVQGTQSRGETYATLSGVTLGLGIVGVGVASVMLLSGGSSAPAEPEVALSVGPTYVGVGGRF